MSTSASASIVGDLASVAAQIQERALILASERQKKEIALEQHDSAKVVLDSQKVQNDGIRTSLLQALRQRHGMELELHRIQEQQEEVVEMNQNLIKESDSLSQKARELEENWEHVVKEILGPHQAKRQLYQRCLEGIVQEREHTIKMEQDRLNFLEQRIHEMISEEEEVAMSMRNVQDETNATNDREKEEDEFVSNVALKIKEALSKRSSLRRTLQQSKETYQKANEDMVKWENACIKSSSR